ncbi:MAG: hypothetical protein LKI58_13070 [Actinomyces sp.]|jgi:hypothetical protein|nr:hypothetical protein [Actinomyces sp.]MCI1641442.1 hypothetical protein [Actinomyces sp.]MCI1662268.1 hypothetical protein [Actinomyces sp.]MCI1692023.1 hypothetical protein [Actinomyces sp.]MCI1788965.1 hypothetical protein [Actinomyces sp.]
MARRTTITHAATVGAQERIAFADAALAVAGRQVTDPELRSVLERQAWHELTGDQAREAIRRRVQG